MLIRGSHRNTESLAINSFFAVPAPSQSGVYSSTKLDLDETLFRWCTVKSYSLYNEQEQNSFLNSLHMHKRGEALITDVPGRIKITWKVEEPATVSYTLSLDLGLSTSKSDCKICLKKLVIHFQHIFWQTMDHVICIAEVFLCGNFSPDSIFCQTTYLVHLPFPMACNNKNMDNIYVELVCNLWQSIKFFGTFILREAVITLDYQITNLENITFR